ncbi:MAG TPA: hypothetical protein EYP20_03625, partial [Aigarchaeota archaeon]|nr:hypothetical protein [Aigarchaeota archaeon]
MADVLNIVGYNELKYVVSPLSPAIIAAIEYASYGKWRGNSGLWWLELSDGNGETIEKIKPCFLIIDSIQTMYLPYLE